MNTAVINIKTNPQTKKLAQKTARELGLSLSDVINGLLRTFVQTKEVTFRSEEIPSPYLIKALKESAGDIKAGKIVSFDRWEDEKHYLDKLIANDKRRNKSQLFEQVQQTT